MKNKRPYLLGDFISDLEIITSTVRMDEERIQEMSAKMSLLLAGGDSLPEAAKGSSPKRYTRNLLYNDPAGRFMVASLVWRPSQGTPIHDHSTWGIVGVLQSKLRFVNYRRFDDGSRDGFAELREVSQVIAQPGQVLRVLPPHDEIHRVENAGENIAISIDVYGREITHCNRYELKSNSYQRWNLSYDTRDTWPSESGPLGHSRENRNSSQY